MLLCGCETGAEDDSSLLAPAAERRQPHRLSREDS